MWYGSTEASAPYRYTYSYNSLGNIASYGDGAYTTSYTYDNLGQLLTATGGAQNYAYTYDKYGNILTANGHSYTYGDGNWKDKLTAFDGQSITYDASGNPTSYYNGTRWTFGWQNGRELATASGGGHTMSYAYDLNGLRTSKVVDGVTHTYLYAGGKLLRETYGGNTLDFFYDQAGQPYALTYNGTTYYYILNVQGDVTALVDGSNNNVAAYRYDPYGKVITATGTLANINPLRYRGYYYDTETGFYYLQSRYYDPSICRFINADRQVSTGQELSGSNMFAYCGNNPVNRTDMRGEDWWQWAAAAVVVAAAAIAVVATAGGAAAAMAAVVTVANGSVVCGSSATTVAAGIFLGSSTGFAVSAASAALESETLDEFAAYGEAALYGTVGGGAVGGAIAYTMYQNQQPTLCFVAGTQVKTEDGSAPIETVKAGDLVWAWDEETGTVALKEVVETYVNESDELIHLFVNGAEIITTPSHPFYSPVKGWTDAVRLRAGDMLVLVNGEYVVVEKVQHEILEAPIAVYNFQVEDYHTYYVANAGVLVHNSCNNSGGRHGSAAHRAKVEDVKRALEADGWTVSASERRVYYMDGKYRYPDIIATKDGITEYYQIGVANKNGWAITRELYAMLDLSSVNPTFFIPYKAR